MTMTIHDLIRAMYPAAVAGLDYQVQDDGHGPHLSAWTISGPIPVGVLTMSAGAFQLFASLYARVRPGAQDLLRLCAEVEVVRAANPEIAAAVADWATDPDATVGGTIMTKSQIATALLLLDMIKELRAQQVGETGLTVEQALWRG
jgi:hypothetical protein